MADAAVLPASLSSSGSERASLDKPLGQKMDPSNQLYILPGDAPEHRRLDLQQELLMNVRNGLFFHKEGVHHALTPKPGHPKPVVLDLGCGSAFWTMEMAKQFPDADVIGLDITVPTPTSPIPPNCRFEHHNLNDGLSQYKNGANVIHAGCISQGVSDNRQLLDEIWNALRPGGVFLAVAGDMQMMNENKQPWIVGEEGEPDFSYHVLWMTKLWDAMKSRGPGINAVYLIGPWLAEMGPEFWAETGFQEEYVPIGPWKENMTEREKTAAELMRQNMLGLNQATQSSLQASGVPEETVKRWAECARDELVNLRKHILCHWLFNWAVKREDASDS